MCIDFFQQTASISWQYNRILDLPNPWPNGHRLYLFNVYACGRYGLPNATILCLLLWYHIVNVYIVKVSIFARYLFTLMKFPRKHAHDIYALLSNFHPNTNQM